MILSLMANFYTYLWLREDGTPYYVGKGTLKRAFRKGHPKDKVIIQEHPSEADALAVEKFLIAYYGRKDLGTGILRNLTEGGEGVSGMNADTRRRIGAGKVGKPRTAEVRRKLSLANLGNKASEETRKRQSIAHSGHTVTEEARRKIGIGNAKALKGKSLTKAHRLNISSALKGKKKTAEHVRKVVEANCLHEKKVLCKRGHKLSNSYMTKSGTRACRECHNQYQRERRMIHGRYKWRQR